MNIVFVGHVDHGKSTVVGRLLADTGSLPEGKLDQVRRQCELNSKPFEYAFLLDALKDEQSQGITIDAARVFFKSKKRDYMILDAPGHLEFLKNMVTGASKADAAILVIDAKEGIQENSRRHGTLLSMLGIRQVAVLINKMDLVDYSQKAFEEIKTGFLEFLKGVAIEPKVVIPVSAFLGEGLVQTSKKLPWYKGPSLLEALDQFTLTPPPVAGPFRMYVQDVYKFTSRGDDRRIVVGQVDSGKLEKGDEVVFYPSAKRSKVKSIEAWNPNTKRSVSALEFGSSAGFTLETQVYLSRGELATRASDPPPAQARKFRTHLFWLGRRPLTEGQQVLFKMGTAKTFATVEKIERALNAATLSARESTRALEKNEAGQVMLKLHYPVAFDLNAETGALTGAQARFVLVDDYEISGGGTIFEILEDDQAEALRFRQQRNQKWETGRVSLDERSARLGHPAELWILTGDHLKRKDIAKNLERALFDRGIGVYYLGMASLLYGLDADIVREDREVYREELLRRLAETSHLLLDAGFLLIVSVASLRAPEFELIETLLPEFKIRLGWVGNPPPSGLRVDWALTPVASEEDSSQIILNSEAIKNWPRK